MKRKKRNIWTPQSIEVTEVKKAEPAAAPVLPVEVPAVKEPVVEVKLVERPLTDAEFLAKVLEAFNSKPLDLCMRVGMGTPGFIRSILDGRTRIVRPFKQTLEAYLKQQKKVIPRTTTEPLP